MQIESKLHPNEGFTHTSEEGFYDFKLLKTTSYASIYRAKKAGKHFLIKTTKDNSERQNAMLWREYELSIGCDHPYCVHVYTFEVELPIGAGIVMEYLEARTLGEWLSEHPSLKERERIFDQLITVVAYLHRKGIIHNDLKPDNILITRSNDSLKLIDFGLADSDAEFALRLLGCTPRYASPELRNGGTVDARSDIYSLGVLLEEIFGSRYQAIAQRCKATSTDDRYPHIDALQKALTHRRGRWTRIVLGASIALVAWMGATMISNQIESRRSIALYENSVERLEQTIDSISNATLELINKTPYVEFASGYVASMSEQCISYHEALLAELSDPVLQAQIATHFGSIYQPQWRRMIEAIADKRTFYLDEPTEEAIRHYESLLEQHLPYYPYLSK